MDYAWDGTTWDNLGSIITIATEITADGQSPVTSQAIYNALASKADTTALANTATSIAAIGTCETAGNIAEKVVVMPTGWALRTGSIIGVLFSNTNSKSNVTLNVNGSGVKPIRVSNSIYTGSSTRYCGNANYIIYYMYTGEAWAWISSGAADAMITQAEIEAGTSTASRTISAKLLSDNFVKNTISDPDYIEMKSGVRLYITDTTPTGTIPTGSVGIGF
jgi:hypothetical protein